MEPTEGSGEFEAEVPAPDPGNSSPDNWTEDLSDDEQVDVLNLLGVEYPVQIEKEA